MIRHVLGRFWRLLNRTFGSRSYMKIGGKFYVKEGFNPPEELFEHLRKYHPEEYTDIVKRSVRR